MPIKFPELIISGLIIFLNREMSSIKVVDCGKIGKFFCQNSGEFWGPGDLEPTLARFRHLGLVFLQPLRNGHKRPNEHPRIPAEMAVLQLDRGSSPVQILDAKNRGNDAVKT